VSTTPSSYNTPTHNPSSEDLVLPDAPVMSAEDRLRALEEAQGQMNSTQTEMSAKLDRFLARFDSDSATNAANPLAAPAPAVGPAQKRLGLPPAKPSALKPNPPPSFDGNRSNGKAFLSAVFAFAELVPEQFTGASGDFDEEKLVRYGMTFMNTGSASLWVQRQREKDIFPFPTWALFVQDFSARFVEENAQDRALKRLETHAYHQGNRDVYAYTDEFEQLIATAKIQEPLVIVSKFRSGLLPVLDDAILTSGNAPDIEDFPGWRARAFTQDDLRRQKRTPSGPPTRQPPAFPRLPPARGIPGVPAAASNTPVAMEVDRAAARGRPTMACFRCGGPHLLRDCTAPARIRTTETEAIPTVTADVIDAVMEHLGPELMGELVARHLDAEQVRAAQAAANATEEDFVSRNE
jgi:hypothetical protein